MSPNPSQAPNLKNRAKIDFSACEKLISARLSELPVCGWHMGLLRPQFLQKPANIDFSACERSILARISELPVSGWHMGILRTQFLINLPKSIFRPAKNRFWHVFPSYRFALFTWATYGLNSCKDLPKSIFRPANNRFGMYFRVTGFRLAHGHLTDSILEKACPKSIC